MTAWRTLEPRYLALGDGRRLAYAEYGDPGGRPLFYFHGSPGSRLEGWHTHQAALEHGFRVIAADRPGVGRSDFHPDYKLLDVALDVLALADALECDRFGVMGLSGGATIALTCASAMPDRLAFAIDLAGWAPVAASWALQAELAPIDRFFSRLGRRQPWLFNLLFASIGLAARRLSTGAFIRSAYSSLSDPDRALLAADPELANFLKQNTIEAFAQGRQGPARDGLLQYLDWGFDLADIAMPVHLFYGAEDKFTPLLFADYKRATIPQTTLRLYPGEGHFFAHQHYGEIFEFAGEIGQ